MQIRLSEKSDTPIYQQIVDDIANRINSGTLSAGHRLPTVRDMADNSGVSRGTVKHAYDQLELMGLIEMTQGRGTFVANLDESGASSKKDRAMKAVDRLLDEMQAMSFSMRDIRIFIDLKMREREEETALLQIGAVDCSPEALSVITNQLQSLPEVEVHQFLLNDVLETPHKLNEDLDLIITTDTHFHQLEHKVQDWGKLMRIVLSTSQSTVMDLARLQKNVVVGVVCVSKRFAAILRKGCHQFSHMGDQQECFFLGKSVGLNLFAQRQDVLVLPINYRRFCSRVELDALEEFTAAGKEIICYEYYIDEGSFLYITEQVERMNRLNKSRLV